MIEEFEEIGEVSATGDAPILFVVGMPGVGKTYWGQRVAEEYGWAFADLDEYIVEQEGRSIAELFAALGEEKFRARETWYLEELVYNVVTATVIACGGGTPCFNDNMGTMQHAGTTAYLTATIPYLVDNINKSDSERPLLQGQTDPAQYLQELLAKRKNIYEQAEYTLDAEVLSVANFAQIITSCTNRH